jgi:hypothetical protein
MNVEKWGKNLELLMNDSSLESTEIQKYVVESRKFFPLSLHSYTIFYLNSEKKFCHVSCEPRFYTILVKKSTLVDIRS